MRRRNMVTGAHVRFATAGAPTVHAVIADARAWTRDPEGVELVTDYGAGRILGLPYAADKRRPLVVIALDGGALDLVDSGRLAPWIGAPPAPAGPEAPDPEPGPDEVADDVRSWAYRYREWEAEGRPMLEAWEALGACRGEDPTLWDDAWESPDPNRAVELCRICPVRPECLWSALEEPGAACVAGVRGGLAADERVSLRRSLTRKDHANAAAARPRV